MATVTFDVVASPLHDPATLEPLVRPIRNALGEMGCSQSEPGAAADCIVVGTGGTERAIVECLDSSPRAPTPPPVLLIAHPRHNSLPAALEALAALRQQGRRGRVVFVDDDGFDGLIEAVDDLRTWHRFRSTRLGLVGVPSDWLVASIPTAESVARRWGPELVDVSIPETVSAFDAVPVEVGRRAAERLGAGAATSLPPPDDLGTAARLEPALRQMIDRDGLDAITVRCFDFLGSIETSGCVALAQLNDAGIVAGCEGDVPAALALLWVRHLLDQPGWIANPASISASRNELTLAHCTIAPSMVDGLELSTHFESGIGVGLHGRLSADEVTLIRIGGTDLDRTWIAEGRVVASGADPDLCRTQAVVAVDDGSVDDLLEDPLGNHLVVVEGRHRGRLERWWRWAIADPGR